MFIAHPVPPSVRIELHAQLAPYRRAYPEVRWTRPASWHLTLLFLGSVDSTRIPELERLVDEVARRSLPYRAIADLGDGRARPREGAAWLGLSTGAGSLIETATLTAEGCPPEINDGPPPKRTPSAHLTVARKADESVIETLRRHALGPLGVSWTVDALELVRSHLEATGARYETLHRSTM